LIKNLKTKTEIILVFLGFSCYIASVCFDFIEGMDEKVYNGIVLYFNTNLHSVQHFSKLVEEIFEMVGNTFFMVAFTKHLINMAENWHIQFVDSLHQKESN
jgi:hypothetical protein